MSDTPETPPDFGEPWGFTSFRNCIRDRHNVLRSIEDDLRDRARVTVNACAGMADPAAEIEGLRQALSGRTASCSQCNESARTIEAMREAIKDAHEVIRLCAYPDHEALARLKPYLK
jgi:hypothetical protein